MVPAQPKQCQANQERGTSQWSESEVTRWIHARHVRLGIPGLQDSHLFTCVPWWDIVVCASACDFHSQLTKLTRKFKDELNTKYINLKCLISYPILVLSV